MKNIEPILSTVIDPKLPENAVDLILVVDVYHEMDHPVEMLAAMRLLISRAGLVVEPSGAAGIAAIAQSAGELAGKRVATPLTGGNLTEQQLREWLYGEGGMGAPEARSRSAR